jgi:hypothetical protein
VVQVDAQRLLAHHVDAPVKSGDHLLVVHSVWCRDDDTVEVKRLEHRLVGFEPPVRRKGQVLGRLRSVRLVDVGHSDDFHAFFAVDGSVESAEGGGIGR